ncbi:MAG TPA: sugar transferase [Puia sp.]|uniref:sugar transferase n=1 Tax=Puia sp. TaxID=2045100 RepID=UPI002C64EDFE|nr:sugar transferase [Puia sp.]HVU95095.1 sugar transferase [Puia sp.]
MNPSVFPKFAQSKVDVVRKGFKHYYVLNAEDSLGHGQPQYSGFMYVGTDAGNISRLASVHEYGSVWATCGDAQSNLLRASDQARSVLPEFIVCESSMKVREIRRLREALYSNPLLRCIPLLVDGTALSPADLKTIKLVGRPDEIISLKGMTEQEFQGKIRFLRSFKANVAVRKAPEIEEYRAVNTDLGLMFKRAFDIFVAGIALLLLSPLMALIALAVYIESGGPVFYVAKRAGRGYKVFDFYKFRTMVVDADKKLRDLAHQNQYSANGSGPVFFKVSNDPRITRVGSLLRNTSLDELPQLFNVLKGDMSLVGNRPLPLYEAENLTTDDYAARFMAPAGITGLWQIKKRGTKDMSVEERISIDIDYANKCSFSTDLWIMAKTPTALLQKENV